MSEQKTYQPTPEQIAKWKRIEELEPTASAGILSEEQQIKNAKELLDPNYFEKTLEQLRTHKEKLLKKLASAEQYEQVLIKAIERKKLRNANKS